MDLKEFQKHFWKSVETYYAKLSSELLDRIEVELCQAGMRKSLVKSVAKDILENGKRCNVGRTTNTYEKEIDSMIYNLSEYRNNKCRFCLIAAPSEITQIEYNDMPRVLTQGQDKEKRRLEFEGFCKILFPRFALTAEDQNNYFTFIDVYDKDSMIEETEKFFNETANAVVCACIIYNGHGSSKNGFYLGNQSVPLNDIINSVKSCWLKNMRPFPGLPKLHA